MTYFFPDVTLKALREIAVNVEEPVTKRIAAMKLIHEFKQQVCLTFGVGAKQE